ncbi:MAG: ABC transporter ATP-binding protein, partial [Nitrosomonas sp.]|nr:ABC transporter ATP-binding protein [Nitrosomonas sp.]
WQFIKQLNRDGHTIVLTTHYLEEAEALCNRVAMLKQGKIVVLDSIRNLIKSIQGLTVQMRLSCEKLPAALQSWPTSSSEGFHYFKMENYPQIELLLAMLRQENIQVLEMQLQQPDLEEVFVKIMGAQSLETP